MRDARVCEIYNTFESQRALHHRAYAEKAIAYDQVETRGKRRLKTDFANVISIFSET